ncbi:MAG TPA: metallophosphoesterase [Myxococcota bacterium]|nr:metallophosphoesterase [Myxococcota bacterium]
MKKKLFSLLLACLLLLTGGCRKEAGHPDLICGMRFRQADGARLVKGDPAPRVHVFGFPASFMLDNLESGRAVSCSFDMFGPQVAPERIFTRYGRPDERRLKVTATAANEVHINYPLASKSYGIVSIEKRLSVPDDSRHLLYNGLTFDIEGGIFLRSKGPAALLRSLGPTTVAHVSNRTKRTLRVDVVVDNVSNRLSHYGVSGKGGPGKITIKPEGQLRVRFSGTLVAGEQIWIKVAPHELRYPYSFVFGGDVKENIPTFLALLDRVSKRADPLFMLAVGDYTRNSLPAELDDFFEASGQIACPVYYVKGNHETRCQGDVHFRRLFGSERFFLVVDRMLFVVLDSTLRDGTGYRLGDEQLAWLDQVLTAQQAVPWKFVLLHTPPSPLHGDTLQPEHNSNLSESDAKVLRAQVSRHRVSYVLSGHAHIYARSVQQGVVYLTSGGGGAKLYTYSPVAGFDIDTRPHLMLFTVYADGIEEEAIRL